MLCSATVAFALQSKHELLVRRKARIYKHFGDLERAYFDAHTTCEQGAAWLMVAGT